MHSSLYVGEVKHRRRTPVFHEFRYRLFLLYLDLAELDEAFRGRWLWSARGPNLAWFRRADYFGDPARPLDQCVRDEVECQTRDRPAGPIRLLTHLRYWGYLINPVSFYFCYAPDGQQLEFILAEVTNTPWGERHAYVLDLRQQSGPHRTARCDKTFHVSPFLEMNYEYRWIITPPGEELRIHIENRRDGRSEFDATLQLTRQPITGRNLAMSLLRHPWMTGGVAAGIYWQALRLWWKRIPFVPHPATQPDEPAVW